MNTNTIMISPQMERVVKCIADRCGMDWCRPEARLDLALPEHRDHWAFINLDGERFSVTNYLVEPDTTLTPEVDMVFEMHAVGWEPIELLYSEESFADFLAIADAVHLPVYDPEGNLYFDSYTEYWAEQIAAQGWVEYGQPVSAPDITGRMIGCQSTNHPRCYGELWQCAICQKTVCCNEGSDDHPALCDDCWAAIFAPACEVSLTQRGTLHLVCDCPEQCGTELKLSLDGFLALSDKDGLLVSFMLPDWLDCAIRRAMLAHIAGDEAENGQVASGDAIGCLKDDVPF